MYMSASRRWTLLFFEKWSVLSLTCRTTQSKEEKLCTCSQITKKGPSIKDVRSQRGLSIAGILRTKGEGVLQMRTSALLSAKSSDFLIFMMCPHGQGKKGLSQCGHLADKGGGEVNFSRYCADVFYGRLLIPPIY